jgi:predicted ribosome quality control (RQC) complex YloA/Tae2 family protein
MKEETINVQGHEVTFRIGSNANENFALIDDSEPDDIWFHINNSPSCHVVATIPSHIVGDKKLIKYIVKQGAVICKKHSKMASAKNVDIIYSKIKNVEKTETPGSVRLSESKNVTI